MAIANYFHITAAGAGDNSGDTWANAMDWAAFKTHAEGALVLGDVHFFMDGSYAPGSTIDSRGRDGTDVSPIAYMGVKAGTTNEGAAIVYSDWSRDSADRPYIGQGASYWFLSNYSVARNFDFESSGSYNLYLDTSNIVENCKFNDTNVAGTNLRAGGGDPVVINCELTGGATGLYGATASKMLFCYVHDITDRGFLVVGADQVIGFNIFDTVGRAVGASNDDNCLLLNNTYYVCDKGVEESTGSGWVILNEIMEGNTTWGYSWTTQTDYNFFWNNHGNDPRCTDYKILVDETTVFQDYGVTTGDPLFETAGSDFRLATGSPCLDTGQAIKTGVGGLSTINKGAWQNPVGGAGGGMLVHPGLNGRLNG